MKHAQTSKIYELVGWIGAIMLLASYGLLATNIIDGRSYIYHSLAFVGAGLVALISYRKRAMQPFVLNVIFCVFAIMAIGSILLDR